MPDQLSASMKFDVDLPDGWRMELFWCGHTVDVEVRGREDGDGFHFPEFPVSVLPAFISVLQTIVELTRLWGPD